MKDTPLQSDQDNASLWEARYQAGDTGWDKGAHHPILPRVIENGWLRGRVLIPGCGRGHDVQFIAAAGEECTAVGIDIAPTAIRDAQAKRRYPNEFYREVSLFTPPLDPADQFDVVWEHTCFCALHPEQRRQYMESASNWLKPDGTLAGVFYLSTKDQGNGPPFKIALDELRPIILEYFVILDEEPGEPTYPGRVGEEILIHARRKSESH